MAWIGTCGRSGGMWQGVGHVTGYGGLWQGWWQGVGACDWLGYVVGGQAYGMDGDMWQGRGHVARCGGMW